MRDSIRTALTWGSGAGVLAVLVLALLYRGLHDVGTDVVEQPAVSTIERHEAAPTPRWSASGEKEVERVDVRRLMPAGAKTNSSAAAPSVRTNAPASSRGGPAALKGEYVLSFYSEAEREAFARLATEKGAEVLDRMALGNSLRLRVKDRALFDELLRAGPTPVAQSPNFRTMRPPNPPPAEIIADGGVAFGGQVGTWLGLPADRRLWGGGVKVAILDSGIGQHPSLAGVPIEHVDLTGEAGNGGGSVGHGTAVGSLVAGSGTVPGVAPGVSLLDIKVLPDDGAGGDSFTLARGIVDAADRGAAVINVSLGSFGESFLVRQAVEYAGQKGAVVVAAVGNDGGDSVLYPAGYDGVVAVGAVDARERTASFSNRGPAVDVVAPGLGVAAAGQDGKVIYFSGTSASAPLVSGAIAAILSLEPRLKPAEAAVLLKRYADDTGMPGEDASSGAGILDPMRVLVRNQPGIVDVAVTVPALFSRGNGPEGLSAVACAQNRGTETVQRMELQVSVDGVVERLTFTDVAPGVTVSHTVVLDSERFRQTGEATLTASAVLQGAVDAFPANNTRTTVVRVRAAR